jgi:hypothetical protein
MNSKTEKQHVESNRKLPQSGYGLSNVIGVSAFFAGFKTIYSLPSRLRRARPGSVLIIVIVLLLLLAILGAAYISTTRSARVASQQNVLNSDVDTMVNGIAKICEGVIMDDLNDQLGNLYGNNAGSGQNVHTGVYQGLYSATVSYNQGDIVSQPGNPGATPPLPPTFYIATTQIAAASSTPTPGSTTPWMQTTHLPVTGMAGQPWLADRIPTPDGPAGPTPYWPNVSQLPAAAGGLATSIAGLPFESPDSLSTSVPPYGIPNPGPGNLLIGSMGSQLVPDFRTVGGGVQVPVLDYGAGIKPIAADADGDGIADSFLFRIPGANYDGLTWYAAVRIVDNNSAINVNTAFSRDAESQWTVPGGPLGGIVNYYSIFPSSVGLFEALNASDRTTNFSKYSNYIYGGSGVANPSQTPWEDAPIGSATPLLPVQRTDFEFLTGGDMLYHQLGRRIANPGWDGSGARFQALPYADQLSLAYHFCLVPSETMLSGTPSSIIESLLPASLFNYGTAAAPKYYASSAYGGNGVPDVAKWFNDNFNYDTAAPSYAGPQPIRALLVPRNPVSNYIAPVYDSNTNNVGEPLDPLGLTFNSPYTPPTGTDAGAQLGAMLPYGTGPATYAHFKGKWSNTATYQLNDIVVGLDGSTYLFIYPQPGNTNVGPSLANFATATVTIGGNNYPISTVWQFQPWTKAPVKANVNTASFRELFRAYWSVMAGNPSNASPFGYYAAANAAPSIYGDTGQLLQTPYNPQHEFRSPLRDPVATQPSATPPPTQLDPPPGTAGGAGAFPFTQPNGTSVTNTNTTLLRAAIAAVNTLGLRDNSLNVISKTFVTNTAFVPSVSATTGTPVEVRVYSNTPQPYITEVYADNYDQIDTSGTTANRSGYIAIELYNPNSVAISMVNWQIAYVNRPTGAAAPAVYPNLNLTRVGAITTDVTGTPVSIPAHGYVLLENYNATQPATSQPDPTPSTQPEDATYRSPNSGLVPTQGTLAQGSSSTASPGTTQPSTGTVVDVFVSGLSAVHGGALGASATNANLAGSNGGELVILRPRRSDGTYTSYSDPYTSGVAGESFNEGSVGGPNLYELVPVDSYDFTGFPPSPGGVLGPWPVWSYIRAKGYVSSTQSNDFKATYPGVYDAGRTLSNPNSPRQDATEPQVTTTVTRYGYPTTVPSANGIPWQHTQDAPVFFQYAPSCYIYYQNPHNQPVQIYNVGTGNGPGDVLHFPNATISTSRPDPNGIPTPPLYHTPFGGFARNGDILDVPFIGAYRVRIFGGASSQLNTANFLELNSVTMDCSMATIDDQSATSTMTPAQAIGRFVPMAASGSYVSQNNPALPDYYAFAANLFKYVTVQSGTDAFAPDIDPGLSNSIYPNPAGTPAVNPTYLYPPGNGPASQPSSSLTADPTSSDYTSQGTVGVEGLVNINTASWKVLSMLPMITAQTDSTPVNAPADNETLAKAIVTYRLQHGPFMSIFDLNKVPGFQAAGTTGGAGYNGTVMPTSVTGMISPPDPTFPLASTPASGNATEDYQWDTNTLTRISNLITTRSDTFTVYIEVQGWQNVGGANAQPIITRHYAFIADRSGINADPSSRYLKTLVVPNN